MKTKLRKPNRKGAAALGFTLIWVYVSVGVVVFFLYLMFSILMPVVGALDNSMYNQVAQMQADGTINESWVASYTDRGVWTMHDAFYWLFWGYLGGLVLTVILYAASRRTTSTGMYG